MHGFGQVPEHRPLEGLRWVRFAPTGKKSLRHPRPVGVRGGPGPGGRSPAGAGVSCSVDGEASSVRK